MEERGCGEPSKDQSNEDEVKVVLPDKSNEDAVKGITLNLKLKLVEKKGSLSGKDATDGDPGKEHNMPPPGSRSSDLDPGHLSLDKDTGVRFKSSVLSSTTPSENANSPRPTCNEVVKSDDPFPANIVRKEQCDKYRIVNLFIGVSVFSISMSLSIYFFYCQYIYYGEETVGTVSCSWESSDGPFYMPSRVCPNLVYTQLLSPPQGPEATCVVSTPAYRTMLALLWLAVAVLSFVGCIVKCICPCCRKSKCR